MVSGQLDELVPRRKGASGLVKDGSRADELIKDRPWESMAHIGHGRQDERFGGACPDGPRTSPAHGVQYGKPLPASPSESSTPPQGPAAMSAEAPRTPARTETPDTPRTRDAGTRGHGAGVVTAGTDGERHRGAAAAFAPVTAEALRVRRDPPLNQAPADHHGTNRPRAATTPSNRTRVLAAGHAAASAGGVAAKTAAHGLAVAATPFTACQGDESGDAIPSAMRGLVKTAGSIDFASAYVRRPHERAMETLDMLDGRGRRISGMRVKNGIKLRKAADRLERLRSSGVSDRSPRYRMQSLRVRRLKARERRLAKRAGRELTRAARPWSLLRRRAAIAVATPVGTVFAGVAAVALPLLAVPLVLVLVFGGTKVATAGTGVGALTGDAAELALFLKSEMSLGDPQVAGIVANAILESYNGTWSVENPDIGIGWGGVEEGGTGIGFVQFSFEEADQLRAYAAARGREWSDPQTQMQFFKDQSYPTMWITQKSDRWAQGNGLDQKYHGVTCGRAEFEAATDPAMASLMFQCGYERGIENAGNHLQRRLDCAEYVYKLLKTGGGASYAFADAAHAPENVRQFVDRAMQTIGSGYSYSGYHWTGDPSTSVFTCSGVPCFALGLPPRALDPLGFYEQVMASGRYKSDVADLNYGDLVFYDYTAYTGRWPGHIGIYLGGGKVLDSIPAGGVQIRDVGYMEPIGGGPIL